MSFRSNKPGTTLTAGQLSALNSFVALAQTPAGQHLAKDATGNFVNTADTGGGGGTPGGLTTQLQYNNAGAFGGISGATTNGTIVTFLTTGIELADSTTNTKKLNFNLASITAATTRTLTVQDVSGTIAVLSNHLGQFGATTSAQLAAVISDETGTGALVFANSPVFTTPNLGTPSTLVGTNITGTAAGLTSGNAQQLVDTNGNAAVSVITTASAVNKVSVTNAATTGAPKISATGTDTNIELQIGAKGTGLIKHTSATYQGTVTATDGATVTFDMSLGNYQKVTLGGNRTLALSNVQPGQFFVLDLIQDGTGSRTVTWFTTIKWVGGTVPTLTTTLNKIDSFGFICTSAGNYQGYILGQNI